MIFEHIRAISPQLFAKVTQNRRNRHASGQKLDVTRIVKFAKGCPRSEVHLEKTFYDADAIFPLYRYGEWRTQLCVDFP
jgi:hypothetical protein